MTQRRFWSCSVCSVDNSYFSYTVKIMFKRNCPTSIYWLIDMRPETLLTWPNGRVRYCGKTVHPLKQRLVEHQNQAQRHLRRPLSKWIVECCEHIRIHVVETVPPDGDWAYREQHWIRLSRFSFPGLLNVADGGEGAPGRRHTAEARAKMSKAQKGRHVSLKTRRLIAAARRGVPRSPETRAKIAAARLGVPLSPETRANISKGHQARSRQKHQERSDRAVRVEYRQNLAASLPVNT